MIRSMNTEELSPRLEVASEILGRDIKGTRRPHYPFYDITSGCNNNDVTAFYGLPYYCTAVGWDPVTGWGSFNALQLAWAINAYQAGGGPPQVKFSGPATGAWYNTDQTVS